MPATTVKLDAPLLKEIAGVKPRAQTLSAFVRETLWRELRRQKMRKAADVYQRLLRENRVEREMMEQWESARLTTDPKHRHS